MALRHFPNPFHNLVPFPSSSKLGSRLERSPLGWKTHQNPLRGSLTLWCSKEQPRKKAKPSRRRMSSEELGDELRGFIAAIGLPENRMPSLKELSDHGRKDLANVVRRRGYKAISELLTNNSDENLERSDTCEEESSGQVEKLTVSPECISLTDEPTVLEECNVNPNGAISISTDAEVYGPSDSSIVTLQFKAAKFLQTGELDPMEDMNNVLELGSTALDSGNIDTVPMISQQLTLTSKEQLPKSRYMEHLLEHLFPSEGSSSEELSCKNGVSSGEDTNFDEELTSKASEKGNQNEINRLKALLHQKEIELSQLEQRIKEEKLELFNLQAKAEAKIANIQRTVAQKDVALRAAEENLNGLKEVHIKYMADGEIVELAGSFNGWQHRIKMDLDPSSTRSPSTSRPCRQPLLWSAVLWLYPGVYEIKFIVDGSWRIDSRREIVSSGNIANNVLRCSVQDKENAFLELHERYSFQTACGQSFDH
ncbi:protein PTST homolog 3, chloroplastic isoform X3 [Typha angustifolia]|uniref:protein PTST homolog 3, chloroplastic isoform X3 n=1 Tax=Typha angustifolia TaxID=59011 RepID=UPI003C2DD7D1